MKQYDLEGAAVCWLHSVITTHWLSMMCISRENGCRHSGLNPMALLDYFGSLRMKPGYDLKAYECHQAPNSWGIVWAVLASTLLSEPGTECNGRPARPEGALDNVMEAFEGGGTPCSYLCASLLAHEFEYLATISPKSEGFNCLVLDADPWGNDNGVALTLTGQGCRRNRLTWKWAGRKPVWWRPIIFVSERIVTVLFHTYVGVGRQRIITFEVRYLRGSYTYSGREKVVANGPHGYAW
jgi:hypothetical protein